MVIKLERYGDRPPADHHDARTWLRRKEVADILKCSIQTVRNHEHRGILQGKNVDGFMVFDPIEVEQLRTRIRQIKRAADCGKRETRGDIEAAVYRMLDAGATRNEIVKILHITAEEAQRIWANYQISEFDKADERERARAAEQRAAEQEYQREQKRLARMKRLRELLHTAGGTK